MSDNADRDLWALAEAVHSPVYFADDGREAYQALGFKGGWMGYFATRSAPLGVVPPAVVTATFYGFAPAMVERALPDAWLYARPEQAVATRYDVFAAVARREAGDLAESDATRAVTDLMARVVAAASVQGAPLFAAYAVLPRPEDPVHDLFWAVSALRELRGDAHVTALRAAAVDGAAANALMVALERVPEWMQSFRGWSDEEWAAAYARLRERGWVDEAGSGTAAGAAARDEIEDHTDRIVGPAWDVLDEDEKAQVRVALTAIVVRFKDAGLLMSPSPTGQPRP